MGLSLAYEKPGQSVAPAAVAGKLVQSKAISCSAQVANAWTQVGTLTNLKKGKQYALIGDTSYSASGVALRFTHPDFAGLHPGHLLSQTRGMKRNLTSFADLGMLPVFGSNTDLAIEVFGTSTDTPVIHVKVVEL